MHRCGASVPAAKLLLLLSFLCRLSPSMSPQSCSRSVWHSFEAPTFHNCSGHAQPHRARLPGYDEPQIKAIHKRRVPHGCFNKVKSIQAITELPCVRKRQTSNDSSQQAWEFVAGKRKTQIKRWQVILCSMWKLSHRCTVIPTQIIKSGRTELVL